MENGTARMHAGQHLRRLTTPISSTPAGFTVPPIPPIPSVVSFDVRWTAKPGAKLTRVTDPINDFTGMFINICNATIWWSATSSAGFTFSSAPAATSTTVSGAVGHERNGNSSPAQTKPDRSARRVAHQRASPAVRWPRPCSRAMSLSLQRGPRSRNGAALIPAGARRVEKCACASFARIRSAYLF